MNSSFLSAFKVLDLNEGPERRHKPERNTSVYKGIKRTTVIFYMKIHVVHTFILVQVAYSFLVGEDDGLVLSDDLPPQVFPTWRQLPQFFQLTHPVQQRM